VLRAQRQHLCVSKASKVRTSVFRKGEAREGLCCSALSVSGKASKKYVLLCSVKQVKACCGALSVSGKASNKYVLLCSVKQVKACCCGALSVSGKASNKYVLLYSASVFVLLYQ
jgi:hypothetical protein